MRGIGRGPSFWLPKVRLSTTPEDWSARVSQRPRKTRPVILSIAGFDPSSGAGVTADIKTIAAHAGYGIACITALTFQSTRGVSRVEPVEGRLITATLEELA